MTSPPKLNVQGRCITGCLSGVFAIALVMAFVSAEPFFNTGEVPLLVLGAALGGALGGYFTTPLWGRSGLKGFGWAGLASLLVTLTSGGLAGLALSLGTTEAFGDGLLYAPQLMAGAFVIFAFVAVTSFAGVLWLVLMSLIHFGVKKMRRNPDMVQKPQEDL